MFENLFAAINVCPKLGEAMFNEDDLFSPPTLNDQTFYDGCMHYKKYTSVMIRVCHSRSRFLSCMYIHDKFMTESR